MSQINSAVENNKATPQQAQQPQYKFKKRTQIQGNHFDKYEYLLKNLKPFKAQMEQKYKEQHNKYYYNILNNKIKCFEKYGQDTIKYYECFDKVEDMVTNNFLFLHKQSQILNIKLDNCLKKCSHTAVSNQDFLQCSEGPKGCFVKYKALAIKLYNKMYRITLDKPQ